MKKTGIKYLSIELNQIKNTRPINNIEEVKEWYQHLVKNPNRDKPFKLIQSFPNYKTMPVFCIIDMENNVFMSEKDIYEI